MFFKANWLNERYYENITPSLRETSSLPQTTHCRAKKRYGYLLFIYFSVGCTCWTLATREGERRGYNVAAILRLWHFSLKWRLCVRVSVPLLWLFPFEEILQANTGVEKCVSFSWVMCCLGRLCLFFFICPPLVYCYRLCVYFCPIIGHRPFCYFWLSSVTLPFS